MFLKRPVWVIGAAVCLTCLALPVSAQRLVCQVDGSDDQFLIYPEQRILLSERYEVYALMGGMTLLTMARSSGRFHRITQLNLLPTPQPVQRFEGSCYNARSNKPSIHSDKRP